MPRVPISWVQKVSGRNFAVPEAQQTMLSEEKIPKEIEKKMKKEAKKKKISKKP